MLKIYASFIIIYCALYFCGYFLKVLLLNGDLKKFDLYITPWLGIGVIVVVLFPLSWLGYSVGSVINYFAVAIAAVNIAVWKKYKAPICFDAKEAAVVAVLGFITATVYGGVLSFEGREALAVSMNGDLGLYLNCVKSVLVSSAREMSAHPGGIPLIQPMAYILNIQLRGGVFVYAFFSALYRTAPVNIMYALSAFTMFLNVMTFRPFLGHARNFWLILPVLAIFPFNTFYQRLVFMAFCGQLFSFGLVSLAFYLEHYLSERAKFDPRTCAALVFVISVNALCWLEGMAFPLLPALAFAVAVTLNKRYDRKICLANGAFAGGLWALCNFRMIIMFVSFFFVLEDNPQGWAMNMPTFIEVAGLQGLFTSADSFLAALIISNLIVAACLVYQVKKEGVTSFLSLTFLIFFITHLAFCWRYFRLQETSSYSVFKSALSLSFIVWIYLARLLAGCFDRALTQLRSGTNFKSLVKYLPLSAAFIACFGLNIANTSAMWKKLGGSWECLVGEDHKAIGYYAESPAYASSDFIINCDYSLHVLAAEYFCPRGRTFAALYAGIAKYPKALMKYSINQGDFYISSAKTEKSLASTNARPMMTNAVYNIYQLGEDSMILSGIVALSHKLSYYQYEGENFDARILLDSTVSLEYMTVREMSENFAFTFFDYGESNAEFGVDLLLNGQAIGKFKSIDHEAEIDLRDIRLLQGTNVFTFKFSGDISQMYLLKAKYE